MEKSKSLKGRDVSSSKKQSSVVKRLRESGHSLYNKGKFKQAIEKFSKWIVEAPEDGDPYFNRSLCLMIIGDYKNAIKDADKAVKLCSDLTQIYYIRGCAKEKLKKYDAALKDCNKALTLDKEFGLALVLREKINAKMSGKPFSRELKLKALSVVPSLKEPIKKYVRAYELYTQKKYPEAIAAFEKLRESKKLSTLLTKNLRPDAIDYVLTDCLRIHAADQINSGFVKEGKALYSRAKKISPNKTEYIDKSIHNDLGCFYKRQKKYRQALKQFKLALDKGKPYLEYEYIGDCYLELGDFVEAEKNYRKNLAILKKKERTNPHLISEAHYSMLKLFNRKKRYDASKRYFKKHVILQSHPLALMDMIHISMAQGDFKRAIEYYEKLLLMSRSKSTYLSSIAECYLSLGDYNASEDYCKKAILDISSDKNRGENAKKTSLATNYSRLAKISWLRQDLKAAREYAQKAMTTHDLPIYRILSAAISYQENDEKTILLDLKQAIKRVENKNGKN